MSERASAGFGGCNASGIYYWHIGGNPSNIIACVRWALHIKINLYSSDVQRKGRVGVTILFVHNFRTSGKPRVE